MGLTERSAQHTLGVQSQVGRFTYTRSFHILSFSPSFPMRSPSSISFLSLRLSISSEIPGPHTFRAGAFNSQLLHKSLQSLASSLEGTFFFFMHDMQPIPTLARHPTSVLSRLLGPSSVQWARLKCNLHFLWKEVEKRKGLKSGLGTLTSCELCAADWEWQGDKGHGSRSQPLQSTSNSKPRIRLSGCYWLLPGKTELRQLRNFRCTLKRWLGGNLQRTTQNKPGSPWPLLLTCPPTK